MDNNKTVLNVRTLLTVRQAAKRMGVSQKRLRSLLAQREFQNRVRQITLRTRHGVRWTAPGIPLDLLADLNAAINPVGVEPAEIVPKPEMAPATSSPEPGTLPAIVYQKLLDEKDARIGDLKLENQKLHAALLLAQNNLARQQVLRVFPSEAQTPSLPPPATSPPPAGRSNGHSPGFWTRLRRFFSDD